MKQAWSSSWKSSSQIRKQRKYRFNAPLHIRKKYTGSHLSKELLKKYGRRSVNVITGDKVKVVRGQYRDHAGKVEEVDVKKSMVLISGIEIEKKDGSKARRWITSSNIIITELNLEDKKRVESLNKNKKESKSDK